MTEKGLKRCVVCKRRVPFDEGNQDWQDGGKFKCFNCYDPVEAVIDMDELATLGLAPEVKAVLDEARPVVVVFCERGHSRTLDWGAAKEIVALYGSLDRWPCDRCEREDLEKDVERRRERIARAGRKVEEERASRKRALEDGETCRGCGNPFDQCECNVVLRRPHNFDLDA